MNDPDFLHDPHNGFYDHPTRGRLQTYMLENTRRTRLYFESTSNEWNRMPLFWERNLPDVRQMLMAIDEALPEWQNVNEQVRYPVMFF
jgi:hypothetical protein